MNNALGGGFTSRLVNEVRVNRGLSYGVGSHFAALQAGGYSEISTFTKNESTKEIIQVCLDEVKKARDKGLTAREISTSKTYLAGLYPLRFETNEAVAGALADLELYGQTPEWIETYRSRLAAVTAKDTEAAAKKYLLTEKPLIVVVGRASEIAPQLKSFGTVEVLKLSDLE
jgi:zinc protease